MGSFGKIFSGICAKDFGSFFRFKEGNHMVDGAYIFLQFLLEGKGGVLFSVCAGSLQVRFAYLLQPFVAAGAFMTSFTFSMISSFAI